jgi:hypothetical protein
VFHLGRQPTRKGSSPPTPHWSARSSLKSLIYKLHSNTELSFGGGLPSMQAIAPLGVSLARMCLSCLALKGKRAGHNSLSRRRFCSFPFPLRPRFAGNHWISFSGSSSGPVRRGSIWRDFKVTLWYSFLLARLCDVLANLGTLKLGIRKGCRSRTKFSECHCSCATPQYITSTLLRLAVG